MQSSEQHVLEYFFGRTVKPGETSTVGLMFRELALTNVAIRGNPKSTVRVKGILDGQEFLIANLSPKYPQCRLDMKFTKDCAFVSFEVEGDAEVDLIGYVTGLDTQKMMSLKEAMELSDASDDEDYVEEEEEEEKGEEEEEKEEEKEEEEEEKISEPTEEKPKEPVKYERLEELPRDKVDFNVEGYKHMGKYIKYKDVVKGTGKLPISGHRVDISYKLTLPTGEVLDSDNVEHSTRIPFPTQFRVGLGHVVKGLDRAILNMHIGGVREILLAPPMGFGEKGNIMSDIRPGECIKMEVNLLGSS